MNTPAAALGSACRNRPGTEGSHSAAASDAPRSVTFRTAQSGAPVFDIRGNRIGSITAADELSVSVSIDGASQPWRITRAFVGENRDALRPSCNTLRAIPGLKDEMVFLSRRRQP